MLRKVPSKSKKAIKTAGVNGSSVAAPPASPRPDAGAAQYAAIAVPAVAPRVDLSILRSPSPPLVDVPLDGYRANSPWVDLAADIEPPRRGSFGFSSLGTSSSPTSRAVNEKLLSYLDDKRITPQQATVLVQECAKVLQGQGELLFWKAECVVRIA